MDKEFEKLYSEIKNNVKEDFIIFNNYMVFKAILLIITFILLFVIMVIKSKLSFLFLNYIFIIMLIFLVIQIVLAILLFKKHTNKYNSLFQKYIIKPIVNEIDNELKVDSKKVITKEIYDNAEFEQYSNPIIFDNTNKYIYFESYLGIYGIFHDRNIQVSKVNIEQEAPIFIGLFCCITLNNCFYKNPIRIRTINNYRESKKKYYKEERIDFYSNLLKDSFNIYTKDENEIKKCLNSENINKIVELNDSNPNSPFEVTIKENKIYIRIFSLLPIEGIPSTNPLNKDEIRQYYDLLKFTFKIIDLFIEIADNKVY